LAKKLNNPLAALIRVPIQNNWDFGLGPAHAMQYNIAGQPGQVVVIGTQPLLQAWKGTNSTPMLRIYGNPGTNYEFYVSTNLSSANWLPDGSVLMTNLQQDFIINLTSPQMYFRAR